MLQANRNSYRSLTCREYPWSYARYRPAAGVPLGWACQLAGFIDANIGQIGPESSADTTTS